jgi:hypothetical protein
VVAAFFRTRDVEPLTHRVEQRRAGIDRKAAHRPIHPERDLGVHDRCITRARRSEKRAWTRLPAKGAPTLRANGGFVPDYYLIPLLLVVMSLGLTALIYWGGFVEERRNRTRV